MTETQGWSNSPRLAAQMDGSKSRTSGSWRRDDEPQPQPLLQELSGLKIGMWKSRTHESLYLLVLPSAFVFVVEARPVRPKAVPRKTSFSSPRLNTLNKSINTSLNASPILKQFVSASPFSRSQQPSSAGTTVFAFEVKFGSIAGVDFQNPLVRQGRLTVEAFGVEKLEFGSLGALKAWYGVEGDGACAACDTGAVSKGRPTSARRGLQFDGEEGCGEVDGTTEVSSFAFCVDGHGEDDEDAMDEGDDVATSRVPISEVNREDSGKKKSRSPWNSLRLRRNANRGSVSPAVKRPPSTDNLPRLTIPPKNLSDEYEQVPSPGKKKGSGVGSKPWSGGLEPPNRTYAYRTISAEFTNPHIPCVLAPIFKQRTPQSERLLKMYESGLPSWAMFLPSYGGYYRPWLRSATWLAFYFFSVTSLTLGFYDLYKTLPGLQDALAKLVESYHISVWWPILSVYQWIESHASIRLSILLTYLFGKSELLKMAVMYVFEPFRVVVMPFVWVLVMPLRLVCSLFGYIMYSPLTFAWSLASRVDMMQAARGNGAGIGVISDAMRQSLVTAMRAANNVWKFIVNMSGGVSRHRMTLSRRAGRSWEMMQDAALAVLGRAYAELARPAGGAEEPGKVAVVPYTRRQNENDSLSFSNAFGQSSNDEEEVRSSLNARELQD